MDSLALFKINKDRLAMDLSVKWCNWMALVSRPVRHGLAHYRSFPPPYRKLLDDAYVEHKTAFPMSAERLEQLRAMLADEPGDLFLRYAIALELKRAGNMEQAIIDLEAILADDPKHIASYYQLALLLAEFGRAQEAISTCEAGAMQCLVTNDRKARQELQELISTLKEDL